MKTFTFEITMDAEDSVDFTRRLYRKSLLDLWLHHIKEASE